MGAVKEPPTPATNGVGAPRQYTLHDFDIIKTIGEYTPVDHTLRRTGKLQFHRNESTSLMFCCRRFRVTAA